MDQALFDAVAADPEADEPRQAYADFLCDRGDPRGPFILEQLKAAVRTVSGLPVRPEAKVLEETHGFEHVAPFVIGGAERGFLRTVGPRRSAGRAGSAPTDRELATVRAFMLTPDPEPWMEDLVRAPTLGPLWSAHYVEHAQISWFHGHPLRRLDLKDVSSREPLAPELEPFPDLEHLELPIPVRMAAAPVGGALPLAYGVLDDVKVPFIDVGWGQRYYPTGWLDEVLARAHAEVRAIGGASFVLRRTQEGWGLDLSTPDHHPVGEPARVILSGLLHLPELPVVASFDEHSEVYVDIQGEQAGELLARLPKAPYSLGAIDPENGYETWDPDVTFAQLPDDCELRLDWLNEDWLRALNAATHITKVSVQEVTLERGPTGQIARAMGPTDVGHLRYWLEDRGVPYEVRRRRR